MHRRLVVHMLAQLGLAVGKVAAPAKPALALQGQQGVCVGE
jgi:xanthosine utilization system XapX-like protein